MPKYLYNGLELPALPEWDRETYPFSWISKGQYQNYYTLHISTGEVDYRSWADMGTLFYLYPTNVPMTVQIATLYEEEFNNGAWEFTWIQTYEENPVNSSSGLGLPVWSNFDVRNHYDGTLYLAASEPVPVGTAPEIDPVLMTVGYRLGCIVRAKMAVKKEPVAYLYNGVRLPKLPEWDREKYPYAFMEFILFGQSYCLHVTPEITYNTSGSGEWCIGYAEGTNSYVHQNGEWVLYSENKPASPLVRSVDTVTWANTDLLNEDGSVCLPKSDPIPVYEKE